MISLTQTTILTILTHNALPLTKSYDKDEQGNVTKTPYPRAKTFTASALDAPNIHALASALTTLANRPQSAVVRASLRSDIDPRRVQRLLHGTGATFQPVDRAWVCADSDKLILPFDTDPTDANALDRAARYLLETHGLTGVSCVVVWSSSAFLTDTATIAPRKAKAHLWFLLDKPACSEALEPWLISKGFDGATARPVQVHYTANPVFAGGLRDPLCWRVKLFQGEQDTYSTEHTDLYDTQEANGRRAAREAEKIRTRRAAREARAHAAPQDTTAHDTRQREHALGRALQRIATASEGTLSDTFYRAANAVGRAVGYDVGVLAALVSAAVSRGTNPRKDTDTITRGLRDGAEKHVDHQPDTAPASGWVGAFANAQPTDQNGVKRLANGERVAALRDEDQIVGLVWEHDGRAGVYGQREDVKDAAFCVGDTDTAQTIFLCVAFKTALSTLQHAPQSAVFGGRYTVKSALHALQHTQQTKRDERREARERGDEVPTQKPVTRAVVYDGANGWERAQAHEAALRYGLPLFVLTGDGLTQTPVDTELATARAVAWKEEQERRMLAGFDVVRMDTPKLPTITQDEGTVCILSGKGTEKTTRAAEYVRANAHKSVLYVAPRVELVEDAARKYGLESYQNVKAMDRLREVGEPSAFFSQTRLAICLPSLLYLLEKESGFLARFDVIVVDEIAQTLRAFDSLVEPSQRPLLWDVWKELIRSARLVLALDAGLDAPTLTMLRDLRGRAGFTVWHNTHQAGAGGVVRVHTDKEAVVQHAQKALRNGQSVFFAENVLGKVTKGNGAHETATALRATGKSGVVVSSETTKERDVRKFLEQPDTARPSWVVATPTINTGFSIPCGVFDTVCASFSSRVGTPSDGTQFVARVRGATVLDVALDRRANHHHAPTTEQRATAYAAQAPFLRYLDGRLVHTDALYSETFDALRKMDSAACREWSWEWMILMVKDGWRLEVVEAGNADARADAAKDRREQVKAERINAVANARELTGHEAKQITTRRLHQADADALKKRALRDAYREDTTDTDTLKELIALDGDGVLRKRIERLELCADTTDTTARAREKRRMGDGVVLSADLRAVGLERELYRRALWAVGVDAHTLTTDAAYTYTAKSERVRAFVEWLEGWRVPLAGVVALPTPKRLCANPLQFLGGLLRRLGVSTATKGDTAKLRQYAVCDETLANLRGWVAKRGLVSLTDEAYKPCKNSPSVLAKQANQAHLDQGIENTTLSVKPSTLASYNYRKQGVLANAPQVLPTPTPPPEPSLAEIILAGLGVAMEASFEAKALALWRYEHGPFFADKVTETGGAAFWVEPFERKLRKVSDLLCASVASVASVVCKKTEPTPTPSPHQEPTQAIGR